MLLTRRRDGVNQKKHNKVKALSTADSWFGLTYPQDSEQVDKKVTALFGKKE